MRVIPVGVHRNNVVPFITVVAALKEMLTPVQGDVAHLIGRYIRGEAQQHMTGKPKL